MAIKFPRTAVELALVYVTSNFFGGIYLPFFPVWLKERGFDAPSIGMLLATAMLLRVIVTPIAGLIADARDDRRSIILVTAAAAFVFWSLAGISDALAVIFVFCVLGNLANSANGPILEGVTMRLAQSEGFAYGHVRLCGSATFVVANVIAGYVVQSYGIDVFVPWAMVSFAFMVAAALTLPRGSITAAAPRPFAESFSRTWREASLLVRHPVFLLFLVASSLVQAGHAFYYGYFTLTYQAAGFSNEAIGWLWGLGVAAEVVLFAFAQRAFTHIGAVPLMAIGAAGAILRWTITAFVPSLSFLMATQILHAASFGATHLGAMLFILRAAPITLTSTAQSVYAVAAYGLFMGAASLASGLLFQAHGGMGFLAMAGMSAVGLALCLILGRIWRGDQLDLARPGTRVV